MAFSSIAFLFCFLPLCLLACFLVPARLRAGRNAVLLVFSLAFYAWGGVRLLPALVVSALFNWAAGLALERRPGKGLLAAVVAVNVLALGYFKYTGFLAANLTAAGLAVTAPDVVLPAGISFFTFQSVAYVTDVYRGKERAERRPLRYLLFTVFFAQLLQGPILRWSDFGPRIAERTETVPDVAAGLTRLCFGLAKKVLLADAVGQVADAAFGAGDRLTVAFAWLGAVAYSLQLYLDFSGYSDMAVGLGRIFGFTLPENFDYPYLTASAGEFWRRWHRTLSSWFRDYVYIPLGGSRCPAARQCLNLLAVWVLTGLWHGAAWTFVVWGLYYFVLIAGERFVWGRALERLPVWLRHVYALTAVVTGWVFFRAADLPQAWGMISAMAGFAPGGAASGEAYYYLREYHWELAAAVLAALPVKVWAQRFLAAAAERGSRLAALALDLGVKLLAGGLLGWSVLRLLGTTFRSFLYFQF